MKTNIKIPANSTRTRVLSAFMAFLIFSLTFTNMLDGLGAGLLVHAYSTINTGDKTGCMSGPSSSDNRYTYSGNIRTGDVEVYDYLTDREVVGQDINLGSWGSNGYQDPYTLFNGAVSATPSGASTISSNITIKYDCHIVGVSDLDIYFFDNGYTDSWNPRPNSNRLFKFDSKAGSMISAGYAYTQSFGSTVPGKFIIRGKDHDGIAWQTVNLGSGLEKGKSYTYSEYTATDNASQLVLKVYQRKLLGYQTIDNNSAGYLETNVRAYIFDSTGRRYQDWGTETVMDSGNDSGGDYFQIAINNDSLSSLNDDLRVIFHSDDVINNDDNSPHPGKQPKTPAYRISKKKTIVFNSPVTPGAANSASPIYSSSTANYTNPLYFGMFYLSNNASPYDESAISSTYTIKNYKNFHWLTNMGLKNTENLGDSVTDDNEAGYKYRGSAAVQKLVEDKLTADSDLSTATPSGKLRQGNNELPYFSKTWADQHPTLMRYYDKKDNSNNIAFPFYEVTTPLSGNSDVQVEGTAKSGDYAKYYQFSSKDSNLYFTHDASTHTGYFTETGTPIWSSAYPNSTKGFFPFDADNHSNDHSDDHTKNNLGFGVKFEMPFTLQPDGCVGVVDSSGKDREDTDTITYDERIHTTFQFSGDDDLWVFIDGNLILDMGGDHFGAEGIIDFCTGVATVKKAVEYTNDNKNDLSIALVKDKKSVNFKSKIAGYNATDNTYDSTPHVITIFYMERGMADSNLLIRFNYTTLNNTSKMKVQEITNFDSVNNGLLDLTMKAAENDVFKYTAYNKGTKTADVKAQSNVYPQNAGATRTNQGIDTVLTGTGTGDPVNSPYNYVPPTTTNAQSQAVDDLTTEGIVKNTSYIWVDDFANMNHETQGTGLTNASDGHFFLMYGTKESNVVDTEDKESSAEFGKQFSRYSVMRVRQIGDDGDATTTNDELYLYKPVRNGASAVTFEQSTRKVDDYYTTNNPYIFSNLDTTVTTNVLRSKNASFSFRNNIHSNSNTYIQDGTVKDANEVIAVQMTEVFENAVNTGAITITKKKPSEEPDTVTSDSQSFTLKIRFEDIFGVEDVDADSAANYTGIKYSVYDSSGNEVAGKQSIPMGSDKVKVGAVDKACGTITLTVGQTATIEGIPYNTKYTVYENEPKYAASYNNYSQTVAIGRIGTSSIDSSKQSESFDSNTDTYIANDNNVIVTNYTNALKIKEVTDFSSVNAGLLNLTKEAAENDVFKYTVSNEGTTNADVYDSGIKTPTYEQNDRTNNGKTTTLTKADLAYDYIYGNDVYGTNSVFLDVRITDNDASTYWDKEGAVIGATFQNSQSSNNNTNFIIGENIGNHIYQFSGFSLYATKVRFFRLKADQTPFVTESDLWPRSDCIDKNTDTISLSRGALYKLTSFDTKARIDTPSNRYVISQSVHYDTHNYTPGDSPSGSVAAANTNYEWKDQFASETPFTGTTTPYVDNDNPGGSFYLMHGTKAYSTSTTPPIVYTEDKESSATFYNQFKRADNSTMTVTQDGTLTQPERNANSPADLNYNGQRDNDTLNNYYSTVKTLEGSKTGDAPNNDDTFEYNNDNQNQSLRITETFTNTPRVGSITITKQVQNPDGTATSGETTEFNFKLQLTNVFGVSGLNVTNTAGKDYSGIAVKKNSITGSGSSYADSSLTNASESTNYYGTFKLKAGETLTIDNIPVYTHYKIIEESSDSNYAEASTSNNDTVIVEGNLNGTTHKAQTNSTDNGNNVTVVNTHLTGELKLKKTVSGDTAPTGVKFTFRVKLTPHDGVNLNEYSIKSDGTAVNLTETGTNTGIFYFDVPNMPYDGTTMVTVSGIPYGTGYEVEEVNIPSNWTQGASSGLTGTIGASNEIAVINNVYTKPVTPTITLTKIDSTNNNVITSATTFYLLKLKDTPDWTDSAILDGFNAVVAGYSGTPTADSTYVETVGGPYTTAGGVLNLSGIESTLFAVGEKYFFYESSAPTGYKKDNNVIPGRIITLQSGNNTVSFSNAPEPTSVTVEKQSKTGAPLGGGEFDLYIHETSRTYPQTYSSNKSQNFPNSKDSITISTKSYSIPENDTTSETTTTTYYNYSYQDETPPSVTEKTWIQPRTDNDYIYFRDFNTGTIGSNDTQAFKNSQNMPSGVTSIDDKRYWLNTNLKYNEQGQKQEIDYTHNYWFAAQFTKDGSDFKQYAIWERFVDAYSFNNQTINTVVWKIQPPDGYNKVRFCLYDGDICIRTTQEVIFQLGKVYTRTDKGNGTTQHGKQCYFDAPINDVQNWSTYYTTYNSSEQTGVKDKRLASTTDMYQADRYEPTEDKIVFHCNSDKVWHNIHIEFFDASNNPIGQKAPGYMMEPYARAGSDYRINGYLTYELTIPKDAKKFRVNNGVDTTVISSYNYHSGMINLNTTGTAKNKGNYFKLTSSNVAANTDLAMEHWSNNRDTSETYSPNNEIESDYDYIYFEKPADWSDHVYAYFYGGGDLRGDNWQRACYSVWPGVAPVGSDYYDPGSGTDYHSDVYTYTYNGTLYSTPTTTVNIANAPDAVYTDKDNKKVYKFRIPMGDRTNYGKVIFNDGLNGGHETKVISYSPGTLYAGNSKYNHFASSSTNIYTPRNNTGNSDEYIYVKVPTASQSTWDDLHIVFYDSAEKRILQKSPGYVMKYAGTAGGYQYYRVPIPANAAKFSVNNGKQYGSDDNDKKKSTNNTVSTGKYDILPYAASDNVTSEGVLESTQNRLVYTLTASGSTASLNMTSPSVQTNTGSTSRSETINQKYLVDYTKRGDKIYIRDTAGWNIPAATASEGGTVVFYDSNNNPIGTSSPYKLIKTVNETPEQATANDGTEEKAWYWLDIPQGATKFTLTSGTHSATNVPIYTLNTSSTGSGTWTTGNMYYETTGSGLAVLKPTFTDSNPYAAYDNTGSRGDDLYIICEAVGNTTPPKRAVQFYDKDGQPLKNVNATYINDKDGKAWYKAAIPTGATTFTVTTTVGSTSTTTPSAKIYELREKASRYRNDYTLGDMQYELSSGNDVLTCTYPVYTEEAVESVPSPSANVPTPQPVLYQTTTNDVRYQWIETTADGKLRFDNSTLGWSTVVATFFYQGQSTTQIQATDSTIENSGNTWSFSIPSTVNLHHVVFSNGGTQTSAEVGLSSTNDYGHNKIYTPATKTEQQYNDDLYIGLNIAALGAHFQGGQTGIYFKYYTNSDTLITNPTGGTNIDGNNSAVPGKYDFSGVSYGSSGDQKVYHPEYPVPDNAYYVQFIVKHDYGGCTTHYNGTKYYYSEHMLIKALGSNTYNDYRDKFAYATSVANEEQSDHSIWYRLYVDFTDYPSGHTQSTSQIVIDNTQQGTLDPYIQGTTTATYVYGYQPEDRYALVANRAPSRTDANDFIKVVLPDSITTPYIKFFKDSGTTSVNTATAGTGQTVSPNGLLLNPTTSGANANNMTMDSTSYTCYESSGTGTRTYMVRLPKNAQSFIINNGTSDLGSAISLYDGTFQHAGSTFNINADGTLASTTRRDYTTDKTDIVYPINPKTDNDYIFFKDDGTFVNGGKVYAYYYGDIDGEYKAWPGVPSQRSYVDNDGKTVYVFQPPKSANGNGTYSKVIFNNGNPTSRVITTAQNITFGNIYTPTSSTEQYGEQTTAAKQVGTTSKSTPSTSDYSSASYIFFRNNGTYTFSTGVGTGNRYVLDDVHIEFFEDESGTIPVGSAGYGYIPDKLSGENIYRITIPNGAKYFRINNGEKSSGSTNYNSRQSEIKQITPNGLYKFVESTTPAEVWDNNAAASSAAELDDHFYYLDLENKIVIDEEDIDPDIDIKDIKLATVVTGSDGKQAYIKWLKSKPGSPTEVDTEYLDHTMNDVYPTSYVTTVKVVKKATGGTTDEDTYYYWVETVAPTGYILPDDGTQKQNVTSGTGTITNMFEDEPVPLEGGKVTLIKLSKEQVGKNPTGTALAGAQFKLIKIKADGTDDSEVIKFAEDTAGTDGAYTTSSSGTFNDSSNWLVTGSDGKLVLNKVPIGSYCLEEQTAPSGYSNLESDGTTKRRVYFSIGKTGPDSIVDKEITMSDEMAPAYIKLYEHINEKRDAWGNPTFIFKIKQTQYYDSGGNLRAVTSSKTQLVALTVDDNVLYSAGLISHSNPDYNYQQWLEESTTEAEYKGMYHIDSQGRIRLEPGTYQISRIPVSRYQFVENTYCMQDDADHSASYTTHKTANEVLTVTVPVSKTAIVHYYDKVDYYDKFSQVDTKVNKFYTLDSTTKENRTIKGIRVEDYRQAGSGTPSAIFIPDTFASNDSTYMEVANSRLKAYFIYADGSEAEITDKDNLSISYVSNDNKVNDTGMDFDDFLYDTENHKMKVEKANDHASERYTLTATYTFTGTDPPPDLITKFDLVFKVAES